MVADVDVACQQSLPLLDIQYLPKASSIHEIQDASSMSPSLTPLSSDRVRASESVSAQLPSSQEVSFSHLLSRITVYHSLFSIIITVMNYGSVLLLFFPIEVGQGVGFLFIPQHLDQEFLH